MSVELIAPRLDDAILIEFGVKPDAMASAASGIRLLAESLSLPLGRGETCCAADETRITAYLRGVRFQIGIGALRDIADRMLASHADGPIEVSRLAAVRVFPGASPHETPRNHYVVRTDVVPGGEAELERWYDEEHMPALAAVPGVVLAQRLLSLDAAPRYYACYDLTSADVLKSAAWQAARSTEWSGQVRPTFRHTRRMMSRWIDDAGQALR